MDVTTTSPGRFARWTRSTTASAAASDSAGTKSTPGSVGVAAQLAGIPLDAVPSAKTSARPPVPSGMTAGRRAASTSRPAPTAPRPAPASTSRVSMRPRRPKSSTWLLASAQASGRTAATQAMLPGLIR
jgi:hypothetical protein